MCVLQLLETPTTPSRRSSPVRSAHCESHTEVEKPVSACRSSIHALRGRALGVFGPERISSSPAFGVSRARWSSANTTNQREPVSGFSALGEMGRDNVCCRGSKLHLQRKRGRDDSRLGCRAFVDVRKRASAFGRSRHHVESRNG